MRRVGGDDPGGAGDRGHGDLDRACAACADFGGGAAGGAGVGAGESFVQEKKMLIIARKIRGFLMFILVGFGIFQYASILSEYIIPREA